MDTNKIYVSYSPDENYVDLCLVSMVSVAVNTKENIEFIINYSDLSERAIEILSYIKNYKNCDIQFKKINKDDFKDFKFPFYVTIETWYRTMLPWLFKELDSIIYLDCDTMLMGDIKKINDIDISNAYFGAGLECVQERNIKRLNLKDKYYINAGVMNINCKKWREDISFDEIKKYACENNANYCGGDQDVINIIFDEKEKVIYPNELVYIETWFWNRNKEKYQNFISKVLQNPTLVHFTGRKPNDLRCKHSKRLKWWEIAKTTPYYTWILEKYHTSSDKYYLDNIWEQ